MYSLLIESNHNCRLCSNSQFHSFHSPTRDVLWDPGQRGQVIQETHQQQVMCFFCLFFVGQAPIELGDAYFEQCHFGVLDGVHVKYGLEGDLRWIVSALASL